MNKKEILENIFTNTISIDEGINALKKLSKDDTIIFNNPIYKKIVQTIAPFINDNEENIKDSGALFSNVEYFGRLLLLRFFQDNGFFLKSKERVDKGAIKTKIRLDDKYSKLFETLLLILEKEDIITIDDNVITTTDKAESQKLKNDLDNAESFKKNLINKYPDMTSHFNLLEICISNYGNILSGDKSPDGIMFPVYSMELVEGIFRGNILADYFNDLISDFAVNYIKEIRKGSPDRTIKIIEVGAGTGGTSVKLMESVKNFDKIEYFFTDMSKVFTRSCEKKFKPLFPNVVFKKLDIEGNLNEQGFETGSFDLVVGSNVIHSTKNLSTTLSNVKSLLIEKGFFLLNEVTAVQDFTTLTFGLLAGWRDFVDSELRMPNSPLLDINGWLRLLKTMNFANPIALSTSHQDKPDSFSQTLFVCEKNDNDKQLIEVLQNLSKKVISINEADESILIESNDLL
ncbi:MAG TPA: class I SAM-dependent methyltransferase [Spirochaetota bacterium]|nr:class I SAM-dependent methyltransferase [Spirochaetota bacterium]HOS33904.1 class I SAM-dependent methyltransferase [Spirochaetota bacterium]HOS56872.1 class I SAM-dependent methyltransferase [Spirochaetota bacterium]HPK62392.1 class I SAM-dependent methyltransferase [Spirochaetota bacterium]HQF79105.1 class I SAM-dependent methyltransferase [Spirochaetota bacterium]